MLKVLISDNLKLQTRYMYLTLNQQLKLMAFLTIQLMGRNISISLIVKFPFKFVEITNI